MSTLLYNPDRKGKDLLISEFVVRTQVYDDIMHDLETSKMKHPEQHYLLVGQRGAGKTTLLNRIKYGIEDSPKLNASLIPILFTEEQYHITELANLWESIGQYLEDYHGFTGLSAAIEKQIDNKNFEEAAFDLLEEYLNSQQKNLVLLIDNIGDLLKKLDKTEVHRLREVLQTKKEIRLIAGSPFYLESILDYQQPLFEFFKVIQLNGLNQHETINLLLKLGDIHDKKDAIAKIITDTPERIFTLRTLTGGVPRTIALMFNIFIDYNDEGSVKDLERILDAVTPLYKHRMDDLPTQQQKIVDAVARNWDAISVKELKEKVRLESKVISAQLRQLEKDQVIEKRETGTKNHLYLLKERFFNIWYLMRYGRKDDRQRVIWLVRFLESWCNSKDLEARVLNYIKKINSGVLDNSTKEIFGQVYTALSNLDNEIKFILRTSVSDNTSTKLSFSDEQKLLAIKRYEKEEKWDKVLELAENVDDFNNSFKESVYLAIDALAFKEPKNKKIQEFFNKIENSRERNLRGDYLIPLDNLEIEIHKYFLVTTILTKYIHKNQIDKTFNHFKYYVEILSIQNSNNITFENNILTQLFCLILALGYYNLLNKILVEIKYFNLFEKFKPVYFALILLKDGKNSSEYLKAGPEIQEVVKEIIEKVNSIKEDYKMFRENKEIKTR